MDNTSGVFRTCISLDISVAGCCAMLMIFGRQPYWNCNWCMNRLGSPSFSPSVRVSYKFAEYKRLSAYAAAGAALHIPVYGKSDSYYVTESTAIHIDRWRIKPPVQWSTNVGLGLQYRFIPKVSVYFEPTLNWYIPSGSSTHTIWTERPFVFSAPFGIRISW